MLPVAGFGEAISTAPLEAVAAVKLSRAAAALTGEEGTGDAVGIAQGAAGMTVNG
jgi:hypothetical protein